MEKRVFIKSLGCAQNRYDAQWLEQDLAVRGFYVYNQPLASDGSLARNKQEEEIIKKSDFLVIGNCALTKRSEENMMRCCLEAQKINKKVDIVAFGCFSGTKNRRFPGIIVGDIAEATDIIYKKTSRKKTESKIQEKTVKQKLSVVMLKRGCDNFCSYCVCPRINRAKNVSFKNIREQLANLNQKGIKEIEFGGPSFGNWKDFLGHDFGDILRMVKKYEMSIRYLEVHPLALSDKVIAELGRGSITRELSVPIQSGADRVLKRMNRKYDSKFLRNTLSKLVRQIPHIFFNTDLIFGFPGETEKDFLETMKLLEQFDANITRIDCYEYFLKPGLSAKIGNKQKKSLIMKRYNFCRKKFSKCSSLH
jgi:tRNA-2-methylthio-N6-dimethylallyladenosine synthase